MGNSRTPSSSQSYLFFLSPLIFLFIKQSEESAPAPVEVQQPSSSRQRLEQFKSRAKRSLTESLEGILKVREGDLK